VRVIVGRCLISGSPKYRTSDRPSEKKRRASQFIRDPGPPSTRTGQLNRRAIRARERREIINRKLRVLQLPLAQCFNRAPPNGVQRRSALNAVCLAISVLLSTYRSHARNQMPLAFGTHQIAA